MQSEGNSPQIGGTLSAGLKRQEDPLYQPLVLLYAGFWGDGHFRHAFDEGAEVRQASWRPCFPRGGAWAIVVGLDIRAAVPAGVVRVDCDVVVRRDEPNDGD